MKRDVSVVILYDDKGRVLLQHRADDAARSPGMWSFFGGGIEEGETHEEAVVRECFEELDYTLENPKLIYQREINESDIIYVYCEKYNPKKKIKLKEGKGMEWYKIDDVKMINIIPHDRDILLEIRSKIETN